MDNEELVVEEEASTMLLSTETQLLLDNFVNLCLSSFTKLAKFGHWLSAWEVLQKTEALVDAYGDQTTAKLQSSMQDRLYRMYGSYEILRQRGLESADCAPTKGIKSLLPADQRPDNVILQLHSLPIESRQQLIFGSKKKNPAPSQRKATTPEAPADGTDEATVATVAAPTRPPLSRPNSARSASASLPPTRPQSAKPPTSSNTYRRPSTDPEHPNTIAASNPSTNPTSSLRPSSSSSIPDVMKVEKFYGRTDPKFNLQGISRRKETNFPTRLQKRPTSAHATIVVKGGGVTKEKASSRPSSAKPHPPPGGFSAPSCYVCSTLPSNGGDVVPTRPKTSRPVTAGAVRTASKGPTTRPNSAKSAASKAPSWANCNSPYLDNVVPLSRKPQGGKGSGVGSSTTRAGKPSLPLHPPSTTYQSGRPPPPTSTTTAVSGLPVGHGNDDFIIGEDNDSGGEEEGVGESANIIPTDSLGLQQHQVDDDEVVSSAIYPILDPATVRISEVNFREWPPYHMGGPIRGRHAGASSMSTTTIGPDGPTATRIHFERQWRSPARVTLYYLGATSQAPSTNSSRGSQASTPPANQIEGQPMDEAGCNGDDISEKALLDKLHKLNARHDEKIDKIKQRFELTPNQVRIVTTCAKMLLAKCSIRRLKSQIQTECDTRVAEENHVKEPFLVPRRPSINSRRDSEIDALEAQLSTRMATIQAKVAKFQEAARIAEANEKIRLATAPPMPQQETTACCVAGCCPMCGSPSKVRLRQGKDCALQTTETGVDESTQVPTNAGSMISTPRPEEEPRPVEPTVTTRQQPRQPHMPRSRSASTSEDPPRKTLSFRHLRRDHLELAAAQTKISACFKRYNERATICMKKGFEAVETFRVASHMARADKEDVSDTDGADDHNNFHDADEEVPLATVE